MRLHPLIAASLVTVLIFATLEPLSAETPSGAFSLRSDQVSPIQDFSLMARHSGMIFAGTALRVQHLSPDSPSGVATTRIVFRVQTAIRGVRTGQLIAIREWDGLWNSGERYRPGERVLLFLFPKSRLGLTSPVGGRMGRFRLDNAWRVELPDPLARRKSQPNSIEDLRR